MIATLLEVKRDQLPQQPRQQGLVGEEGVLYAMIAQAAADLRNRDPEIRADALAYFASENYRVDLFLAGLPTTWLPIGVHRVQ